MRASIDEIILALDRAVRSARVAQYLDVAMERTAEALAQSNKAMSWETIPLDIFEGVPDDVRSCWVFRLRASQNTGAERHPNSHQRSMSLTGQGTVELRLGRQWQSMFLISDPASTIDSRWASIPRNTWHRWLVGPVDWCVLSFHTVPAADLIEERPSSDDLDEGGTERRRYQAPES